MDYRKLVESLDFEEQQNGVLVAHDLLGNTFHKCLDCGKVFKPARRKVTKFCSASCRVSHSVKKSKAEKANKRQREIDFKDGDSEVGNEDILYYLTYDEFCGALKSHSGIVPSEYERYKQYYLTMRNKGAKNFILTDDMAIKYVWQHCSYTIPKNQIIDDFTRAF